MAGFLPPIADARALQLDDWKKTWLQEEGILEGMERRQKEDLDSRPQEIIYLNIYHVASANKCLETIGFGIYHTAAQLYGYEFSYGGHDFAVSGIVVVKMGNSAGLTLKESIPVAVTHYSEDEVN
jgi:hypothetical protein